jgi:hypothetical protein
VLFFENNGGDNLIEPLKRLKLRFSSEETNRVSYQDINTYLKARGK